MTREEAIKNFDRDVEQATRKLMLAFESEKKSVIGLWLARLEPYGAIKVEEWSEGLVVWVGGQIRYKSWE